MVGSSASKKVARAARTGGGRRRDFNTNLNYYALLVVLTLLGTAVVVYSRDQRLSGPDPGSTPPLATVEGRAGDHWFVAYGVYICDKFVPPINNPSDPYGSFTKNDGVIYVQPRQKKYAGSNANLGLFAKAVGLKLTRDSLQVPGDPIEYRSQSSKCGEKPGELVIKTWSDPKGDGKVNEGDPTRILLKDGQGVTIAFVPQGERNIPLPTSVAALDQAKAKDAAESAAQEAASGGTPESPSGLQPGVPGQGAPVPGQGGAPSPQPGPSPGGGSSPAPVPAGQ